MGIALGTPSHGAWVEHVEVREDGISFELATESPGWIETEVPVTGPIVAVAIDSGSHTFVSRSERSNVAVARYAAAHELRLGWCAPALLEQGADGAHLHVFPIASGHPARIRLYVAGEPADWMTADPIPRAPVSAEIALYAGPAVHIATPTEIPTPRPWRRHAHVPSVPRGRDDEVAQITCEERRAARR